jgi:hypothetical protein
MIYLVGALTAGIGLKLVILACQAVPFNADEAVVALMGRHILQGELPLFFYGQAYMGSLDAFFVAVMFKLIGYQVWGIRAVQMVLYTCTLATTYWLAKQISGKWQIGVIATWLLALPTITMTLYTTVSMGGYGEMLLLGNLILITTISISKDNQAINKRIWYLKWFSLGLQMGFGLWVFGMSIVYSLPALCFLVWNTLRPNAIDSRNNGFILPLKEDLPRPSRRWASLAIGGLLGALPWLLYTIQKGFADPVIELSGAAISGVESLSYAAQLLRHGLNLSLFGSTVLLGLRPAWAVRWLGLPLAPIVLAFWGAVFVFAAKKTVRDLKTGPQGEDFSYSPLLSGVVVVLILGFILSPFGADPSGRYFLPVAVILALYAAQAVWYVPKKLRHYALITVGLVILFNLWGTYQSVATSPGVTTQFDSVTQIDHAYDQRLIDFLQSEGEEFGYTNYWVAYPLAFLSEEDLVYVPSLPYHPDLRYTSRDNRYGPYTRLVAEANRAAYITTNNPRLDAQIRNGFQELGLEWKEKVIGDYQVYYRISEKVDPNQIGLGGEEG